MFIHNLKYALKTLFKNKVLLFWTFAFPLILATFFNMAFSNINDSEKLEVMNIAIIENEEFQNSEIYKETFSKLSDKDNDDRLFDVTYATENEAKKLLEDNEIVGYLTLKDGGPEITVSTSGINQTIFKYVTEEIAQSDIMISSLIENEIAENIKVGNYNIDYENINNKINELINSEANIKDISKSNLDYVMIEFYTLIAMSCMYGGILAMVSINQNLANMSSKGKRISIAPTRKIITISSSLLASYIAQLLGLAILFAYTILALQVDYGDKVPFIIILSCIGSFAGLCLGTFIGTIIKKNENIKTGLLISITMFGSFLAGMFGITMKYVVDKNAPFLNKINPVNMITDGLYSLYYYDTLDRYLLNIISLIIFSLILIIISLISLRRQKYDSI